MAIVKLDNPKSYKEAGDMLLENLDLNNVQIEDYNNFFRNVLPRHLSQPILHDNFELKFVDWYIDDSMVYSEEVCKSSGYSREVSLWATGILKLDEISRADQVLYPQNTIITFPIEITRIPMLSSTGSFLIKGVDRVMVSHLERANTLIKEQFRDGNKSVTFEKKTGSKFSIYMQKNEPRVEITPGPSNIITTTNLGQQATTRTNLMSLLRSMNIDTLEDAQAITGMNPYLHGMDKQPNDAKDHIGKIERIRVSMEERALLNQKLSFRTRLSGRTLAQDITTENITLKKGHVVKPDEAEQLQQDGITNILIEIPGGTMILWNNGFVQPDGYIPEAAIVDTIRKWDTKPLEEGEELQEVGKFDISLAKYREIERECLEQSLELREHVELHQHGLLGAVFTKEDVIASINLFSMFLMDLEKEDDIDSLTNKSLVNISTVYEDLLIERLYGTGNSYNSSITSQMKDNIGDITMAGKERGQILKVDNLSCVESNTISSSLVKNPWSKLFQVESNVNPLDEINHKRKISLVDIEGRGGIKADYSDPKPRSVNPSHLGRICPIESPESGKVGLVVHLASLATINENGIIEAPFFKINHEEQRIEYDKAIYMDYEEEQLYTRAIVPRIAEEDFATVTLTKQGTAVDTLELEPTFGLVDGKIELTNKPQLEMMAEEFFISNPEADAYKLEYGRKDWFIDEIVDCIEGDGHLVKVPWEEIDYVTTSGEHVLSAVTGNIPFGEYDDGTRLMMGASMSKQTEAIMGSERPLIGTRLTDKIGAETNRVITAPFDGIVTHADNISVTLESIEDGRTEIFLLEHSIVTSDKSIISNVLNVSVGDLVLEGDVIADIEATKDGQVQIGTNLVVAYIPWYGYNYEDAIVISERLVKEDVLTSYRAMEYGFTFNNRFHDTPFTRDGVGYTDFLSKKSDDRGIIKVGTNVTRGDVIALKVSKDRNIAMPVRYDGESDGIVAKVEELPDGKGESTHFTIVIESKEKINIGDKLAGRHGNKGVISKIYPEYKMPRMADGTPVDIILTPLGIPSRMNIGQLFEAQLGLILHDAGLRANYDSRNKVDVPLVKKLTNEWVGSEDGKVQLYDGATGKPLIQKSTVGVTTIHKLKHLAGYSIYGRGSGDASQYTAEGHPTQGKKRGGGQRIGEMEMWALQAHGASACLKELQTYKSDDPTNRVTLKKHLRGDTDLTGQSNIPRSYRMAIMELMSRGIDIKHYDVHGNEVDITQDWVGRGADGPKLVERSEEKFLERLGSLQIEKASEEVLDLFESYIDSEYDDIPIGSEDLDSMASSLLEVEEGSIIEKEEEGELVTGQTTESVKESLMSATSEEDLSTYLGLDLEYEEEDDFEKSLVTVDEEEEDDYLDSDRQVELFRHGGQIEEDYDYDGMEGLDD